MHREDKIRNPDLEFRNNIKTEMLKIQNKRQNQECSVRSLHKYQIDSPGIGALTFICKT